MNNIQFWKQCIPLSTNKLHSMLKYLRFTQCTFKENAKQFLISDFTSQNHHLPMNTYQPQHQTNPETDTYDRIRIKKRHYKASTLPNDTNANTNIRRDRNPGSNRYVVFLLPIVLNAWQSKTQTSQSFVRVIYFYYLASKIR